MLELRIYHEDLNKILKFIENYETKILSETCCDDVALEEVEQIKALVLRYLNPEPL